MRTSKYLVVCMAICLAATIGIGLSSCKKDEPTPVIVENPLDAEVYYITGKVISESNPLEGVKVSTSNSEVTTAADGTFQLEMESKSDCVVTFEKNGYVTVKAETCFHSDAKKQSVVSLVQELVAHNQPLTISHHEGMTIVEDRREMVELEFSAGTVKLPTDITVTAYKEGAKKIQTGKMRASLSTVNCEPEGQLFEKQVVFRLKNGTSNSIYFDGVKHYERQDMVWNELDKAEFDGQIYHIATLNGFSRHSFGVVCSVQKGTPETENHQPIVIDNLGKMDSKEQTIAVTAHMGWEVDGVTTDLLKKQLTGLSDSDVTALANTVEEALASLIGGTPQVEEMVLQRDLKVSGDMKVTVSIVDKKVRITFGFPVVFNGQQVELTIPIIKQEGVDLIVTTEKGASHGSHSGGSGQ